jgi:hypothetical protein
VATATGQNLVDTARSRSGYQNTQFVTDAEVLGFVNDRCIELRDLINEQDESYGSQPYPFTLPDAVLAAACAAASLAAPPPNFAALPDDCDRAQGLDLGNGAGPFTSGGGPGGMRPETVHEFSFQNRNDQDGPRFKMFGRIAGKEVLMVQPEQSAQGNYRLWYIPQWVPLALTDSLDMTMNRFNRYISIGAGIDILTKAKRDTSSLEKALGVVARAVATMSQNRETEAEQGGTDNQSRQTWPYYSRWR